MANAVFCHHLHEFGDCVLGCARVNIDSHDVRDVHSQELIEFAWHCANDIAFRDDAIDSFAVTGDNQSADVVGVQHVDQVVKSCTCRDGFNTLAGNDVADFHGRPFAGGVFIVLLVGAESNSFVGAVSGWG